MSEKEIEVVKFMESIQRKYFPALSNVSFKVTFDRSFDGVAGQAIFGKLPIVVLHYSDSRILEPAYRMGLIPVIAHELAHYIDPVDPEKIMRERLPAPMMSLWEELLKAGHARCSMGIEDEH